MRSGETIGGRPENVPKKLPDSAVPSDTSSTEKDEVLSVGDSMIMGPADAATGKDEVIEVGESAIMGAADSVDVRGGDKGPSSEMTTDVLGSSEESKERAPTDKLKKLNRLRDEIQKMAQDAKLMVPKGEDIPELPEDAYELIDEIQEKAIEAERVAREGAFEAIGAMDAEDPARLDAMVEFMARYPDYADDLKGLGLSLSEQTVIAVRLARSEPKAFLRAMARTDLGLEHDEELVIAEEFKSKDPELLIESLKVFEIPTDGVRMLLDDLPKNVQERALRVLGIPSAEGGQTERDLESIESKERESARVRSFERASRDLALEIELAFPERVGIEREKAKIEAELRGKMTAARDFAKTSTAPKVLKFEGRALPGVYKSEKRERDHEEKRLLRNAEREQKLSGKTDAERRQMLRDDPFEGVVRPGIEPGTSPAREWLAFQIDRALQIDRVPVTIMREGPDGIGSVQDWNIGASLRREPWLKEAQTDAHLRSELARIALLDVAMTNSDRHSGNFTEGPDGKLIAIDNGNTHGKPASKADHVRSFPLWAVEGTPLPADLRRNVEAYRGAITVAKALEAAFKAALGKDANRAWKVFNAQLDKMMKDGFPTEEERERAGSVWPSHDAEFKLKFLEASS